MLSVFGGKQIEVLNQKLSAAGEALVKKNADLSELRSQYSELLKKHQNLELDTADTAAELAQLKTAFDKLKKENKANYESFLKAKEVRDKLKVELEELRKESQKEATANKSELTKLSTLQANFDKLKAKAEEFRVNNELNYKNYLKIAATQKRDLVKIKDLKQEKELLLLQLNEAGEQTNQYFLELQKLRTINQALSNQVKRFTANNPHYVDYGGIDVLKIDTVSDTPQILWRVTDYTAGSVVLPEFYFRTCLQDGLAGISLVQNPQADQEGLLFIPLLINKDAQQLDSFKGFSGLQWAQLQAACSILIQLVKNNGQGLSVASEAQQLDLGFWQNSFTSLHESISRLPNVFRYEKIKLKRELQNPDYEHLWLEFHDASFGEFKSNKFELRIGAAMIDRNGFSLLPKLEFPLIDGKHKPFASWFAESSDDFGQKFELRFSLEKQVFDLNTYQKLSVADQKLLQVLAFVLPTAINKLIKSRVSIHRPWASWSSFVNETVAILLNLTRGLQAENKPKPASQNTEIPVTQQDLKMKVSDDKSPIASPNNAGDAEPSVPPPSVAERYQRDLPLGESVERAPAKLPKKKSISVVVTKKPPVEVAPTAVKSSPASSSVSKSSAKSAPKKTTTKSREVKEVLAEPIAKKTKERAGAT